MKSILVASSLFAVCATSASAQTPTLLHGQKVLTKDGTTVVASGTLALPSSPLVGGSDTCATPDVVVGTGTFAYDNTAATVGTEGQAEALCLFFTTTAIDKDVWFRWNATFTGTAQVDLCGLSTMDSKVAIYTGTACPTSAAIACNDDSCALQSSLSFPVTSGTDYVIQLGRYPVTGGVGSAGQFKISQYVPPVVPPNDDCSTPIALNGPGTTAFDTTLATTGTQGQAESLCNFIGGTAIGFDVWYTYTPASTGVVTVTTCGGLNSSPSQDSKIAVYNGAGCPTTPAIACNDDATCASASGLTTTLTFNSVCGQTYILQVGRYINAGVVQGTFTITEAPTSTCGPAATGFCFGDGTGNACPCGNVGAAGNGCANSINANGANLSATGSTSIASDSLVITGAGMPNSTCLYFQGTTQLAGTVFGDGLRCAGGAVIRLGTKVNAGGTSSYPTGADPKISIKGLVAAPGTRTYQSWYRNSAAFCTVSTFNLSNGLLVTWN